jgi:hypothetical protein
MSMVVLMHGRTRFVNVNGAVKSSSPRPKNRLVAHPIVRRRIMAKRHCELILARKYYGKHATGSVVLVNGHPEFHGPTKEAKAFYTKLTGGTCKRYSSMMTSPNYGGPK